MNDDMVGSERHMMNRRFFAGMIGWLLTRHRRPGMIGAATAFQGLMGGGHASLARVDEGWDLASPTRRARINTAEVIRLVSTGELIPRAVEVVPDLAELLFMEAVHQAEVSIMKIDAARPHVQSLRESNLAATSISWVMATVELDRSVRASIASIVLSIAASEAQVNLWADSLGGWSQDEDRLGVAQKCKVLAGRSGQVVDLGSRPFQSLQQAVKRRNAFVHAVPVPEPFPTTGSRALVPGHSLSVEARRACLAVRSSLISLARLMEVPIPAYLSYCPPGPPDDIGSWRTATVLTGLRNDPDFPPKNVQNGPSRH